MKKQIPMSNLIGKKSPIVTNNQKANFPNYCQWNPVCQLFEKPRSCVMFCSVVKLTFINEANENQVVDPPYTPNFPFRIRLYLEFYCYSRPIRLHGEGTANKGIYLIHYLSTMMWGMEQPKSQQNKEENVRKTHLMYVHFFYLLWYNFPLQKLW